MKKVNNDMFTILLANTLYWGVREMFKKNPVKSDVVSSTELVRLHVIMYADLLRAVIDGKSTEEINQIYEDHMKFMGTLTTKF